MNQEVSLSEARRLVENKSIVWAKLRGYPWWPGRIKSYEDCPEELASIAKSHFKTDSMVPVYFFGSHDYSLVSIDCLRPYAPFLSELSGKSVGKSFRRALVEAQNPDKYLSFELAHKSSNGAISPVKRKRGRPPKSELAKKKSTKNKKLKRLNEDGTLSSKFLLYCRTKLQKILLRTTLKTNESEVGIKILEYLGGSKVDFKSLYPTKICRVLRLGFMKHKSDPIPSIISHVSSLLQKWRVESENFLHDMGL